MSNGITPNDHNRINQAKMSQQKKQQGPEAEKQEAAPVTPAPIERQTIDPDRMMDLMAQMGAMNMAAGNVENVSVGRNLDTFLNNVTPDAHAKLYSTFENAIRSEFGIDPSPELVQEALDNYLIGTPVVQQ